MRDLSVRESLVLAPLVALALLMGVASPLFTRRIEPAADALVQQVRQHTAMPAPTRAVEAAAPQATAGEKR